MSDQAETLRIIEAVLFVAEEAVETSDLAQLLEMPTALVEDLLIEMGSQREQDGRGVVLRKVAGGWRFATDPGVAPYLERFVSTTRSARLSQAALETLAIVAYRQPVSRGQINEIRGVLSEAVLRTLIVREMIEEVGRDEGPGQAILYGTTDHFLERLGLSGIEDLPALSGFMPDTEAVERMESGLGPAL